MHLDIITIINYKNIFFSCAIILINIREIELQFKKKEKYENFSYLSYLNFHMFLLYKFIHAFCHLLGYNHDGKEKKKQMFLQERLFLRSSFNFFLEKELIYDKCRTNC